MDILERRMLGSGSGLTELQAEVVTTSNSVEDDGRMTMAPNNVSPWETVWSARTFAMPGDQTSAKTNWDTFARDRKNILFKINVITRDDFPRIILRH